MYFFYNCKDTIFLKQTNNSNHFNMLFILKIESMPTRRSAAWRCLHVWFCPFCEQNCPIGNMPGGGCKRCHNEKAASGNNLRKHAVFCFYLITFAIRSLQTLKREQNLHTATSKTFRENLRKARK